MIVKVLFLRDLQANCIKSNLQVHPIIGLEEAVAGADCFVGVSIKVL